MSTPLKELAAVLASLGSGEERRRFGGAGGMGVADPGDAAPQVLDERRVPGPVLGVQAGAGGVVQDARSRSYSARSTAGDSARPPGGVTASR
ncbi:hypothetical protein [Micromonospora sp. NPDC005173]|uniref:hypothetical protein n=1 Tax=Micromonospora sp. NPDC005173 TaxID=3157165 RepID=UPI0033A8017A